MVTLNDRTDLELFFNPLLAANTPQNAPTPQLLELVVAINRLVDSLTFAQNNFDDKADVRRLLEEAKLFEMNLRADQSRNVYLSLISLLSSVSSFIKKNSPHSNPVLDDLKAKAKKALISLVLLARESDDTVLKDDVLSLAKRWEAS